MRISGGEDRAASVVAESGPNGGCFRRMRGVAVALSYGSAVAVEKYGGAEGGYLELCGGSWGGQLKCEAALKRLFEIVRRL